MKLLFFKASWCNACHAIEDKVPEYAQHISCDTDPDVAERYNVNGLPCFVAVNDGDGTMVAKVQTTDMSVLDKWYKEIQNG